MVTDVLTGLRERGLDTTRPILVVLDGAKALRRAVLEVFDHPVIQRCQLHKLGNVTDRLPEALAWTVAKRMRAAYRNPDPLVAQAELEALARELDRSHPGAAASWREGLAETSPSVGSGCHQRSPGPYAAPIRSGCCYWPAGSRDRRATWSVIGGWP